VVNFVTEFVNYINNNIDTGSVREIETGFAGDIVAETENYIEKDINRSEHRVESAMLRAPQCYSILFKI
jgi:hypothetical protein